MLSKADKESIEQLNKLMDSAYLKPKRTSETMLSTVFVEIGWIEPDVSAYGIQTMNAFTGKVWGVYLARKNEGKIIREIEYNKLFFNEREMKLYVNYIRGLKL